MHDHALIKYLKLCFNVIAFIWSSEMCLAAGKSADQYFAVCRSESCVFMGLCPFDVTYYLFGLFAL